MSEIITIKHIETHPNMNTWAPIRRNVLTEDDYYHSQQSYKVRYSKTVGCWMILHLQSSQSLLCRRCFVYNCALHNDPPVDAPPKVEKEEIPLPTSPCGADCYLYLPSTLSGLPSKIP